LDRDISHVTYHMTLPEGEDSEDSPAGQTWLSLPRIRELAEQVIVCSVCSV